MLMNRDLIVLELAATSKEEAIEALCRLAYKEHKINSIDDFTKSVFMRENMISTGVGRGIAIPHGKSKAVKEPIIVFGKLKEGVQWSKEDNELVKLIFLIGVPEDKANDIHLKLLAKLSRMLMQEEFINTLKEASSIEEVFKTLSCIN